VRQCDRCIRQHHARGLCRRHYDLERRKPPTSFWDELAERAQPGDFQRHPTTTAPFVNDPVAITKAGKPKRVQYGRPSSFTKQIENGYALLKWSERRVAVGAFLLTVEQTAPDLTEWTGDDDAEWRETLDRFAIEAKDRSEAYLAAHRGTHAHEVLEAFDTSTDMLSQIERGEVLGIPAEIQRAIVRAWARFLTTFEIEILATEALVVDDRWRLAGRLDRVVRLGRSMTFGEVTLEPGTVIILDLKAGQLRTRRDGHPMYWQTYAGQIASYAQSLPYVIADDGSESRGSWPFEIDQSWAVIAHVAMNLETGQQVAITPVLVDLAAGRVGGEITLASKVWARSPMFSTVPPASIVETV